MFLQQWEETFVTYKSDFDDLCQTRRNMTQWQGSEECGIEEHSLGRIETPERALPLQGIDSSLYADTGVDLAHQGGRDSNVSNPSAEERCCHSDEVRADTATHAD